MARGPLASLDKGELFARYMATQRARENSRRGSDLGLGSMFQEEGPGRGPSSGLAAKIASIRDPERYDFSPQQQKELVAQERREEDSLRRGMLEDKINPFASDLKSELAKMRRLQGGPNFKSPEADLNRMALDKSRQAAAEGLRVSGPEPSMTLGAGANELSPLDMIAENLQKAQAAKAKQKPATSGAGDEAAAQNMIAAKKAAQTESNVRNILSQKMDGDNLANLGTSDEDPETMVEDTFMGGMSEVLKALEKPVPEMGDRKELLQKYMDEFSEATGIPTGGKVDKSQALMAMGLALMQNRAGKGFNVGNILSSIGEAGQAAMPYLTKAKDEAKQARIAAGKYALQKIKSDEDASAAIEASNDALKRELLLEDLKFQQERQLQIDKARLEGNETKLAEALKNTKQQSLSVGGTTMSIGYGRDVESGGKTVFATPEPDARVVAAAYKKTGQGLDTLRQMEDVLIQIRDAGDQLGGSALQGATESLISIGNSMGMKLQYPSGGEVGLRDQFDVLKGKVLLEFKKFMAQETGNGISNVDVENLDKALGDTTTYFQDPERALMAIREVTGMFERSKNELDPLVDDFMNRNFYTDNEAGDTAYNYVVDMFSKQFSNVGLITPTVTEGENGETYIDYDIRGM